MPNINIKGYKSYIVGIILILASGLAHTGYIDEAWYKVVEGALLGAGIITIRAGMKNSGPKDGDS